jgi:hypothetical protein
LHSRLYTIYVTISKRDAIGTEASSIPTLITTRLNFEPTAGNQKQFPALAAPDQADWQLKSYKQR